MQKPPEDPPSGRPAAPQDTAAAHRSTAPQSPDRTACPAAPERGPARPGGTSLLEPPELNPHAWNTAARRLLAKMISEFAHEEIVTPQAAPDADPDHYTLTLDDGARLEFRARRCAYDSWRVVPGSFTLRAPSRPGVDGQPHAPSEPHTSDAPAGGCASGTAPSTDTVFEDPILLLTKARTTLGLDGATLGHLVRELSATLAADAKLEHSALTAARLADLDYAALEGHQTGHPWIVLNKGRLGFSATDAATWAPEARHATSLPWIAVRQNLARYEGVPGLASAADLYQRELDAPAREAFATALVEQGRDPREYLYLPVHPWQWDDIVLPLFAQSVAAGDIVPLPSGVDTDLRLPQQSIRTFLNVSRPDRHTVKLPLSVLNTLVWRGLPTERTSAAPAVTAWVHGLRDTDPFLRDTCRVILLGEVASVAVPHPVYDGLDEVPYQYKELLGAIWREPLDRHLAPGERARTLAALLHTDPQGRSFTAELVERSGLDPRVWLRHLFAALLPALLHFLYRYGTVFSPHGENAIVVFDEQDVPVRLAVKDFVDDVNISATPLPEHASMPDDVRRVLLTEPPEFLTQFIHSGLFVGVFRYLAPLCEDHLAVPEREFWSLVRAEILHHQARFPELKDRFDTFDLLTERIERLCLNRNRLHLDGYRDRPDRPHAAVHGTVPNPLHAS